jgi:uncharacterized repeat protein (TIGR01451 family)
MARCWLVLVVGLLVAIAAQPAHAERPFAPRFTTNVPGNVTIVGNTLMTCPASATCATVQQGGGSGAATSNNAYSMQRVDVDADPSTFDSSSATLALPAGARVLFAGLYYGARVTAGTSDAARATVRLRVPGAAGYQTLGPAGTVLDNSTIVAGAYGAFVNVTAQVAAAGPGTYTVANVQSATGVDRYAGWALAVAYEVDSEPLRNVSVFDGLATVAVGSPGVTIPFTGFQTPPVGPVRTTAGFVVYEGDRGSVGDTASLNGRLLQDATNPSDNFFNSSISQLGVPFTAKSPNYDNQLGFDTVLTGADGYLPNGASGATLRATTNGEQYLPQTITLATELFAPQVHVTKSVQNLSRTGPAQPGDRLRYSVRYANVGSAAATDFVAADAIPAGTEYVRGSLAIGGADASDASGDDTGEFDRMTNRVVARAGAGATASAGGTLGPDATATLTFDVRVEPEAAALTQITNVARADFVGVTRGIPMSAESDPAVVPVAQDADLSVTKLATPGDPPAGHDVTYTIVVRNNGPSDTAGARLEDALPDGLDVFSVRTSQGNCTRSSGQVACTFGTLEAGGSAQVVVAATIARSLAGERIVNRATVASDKPDPNPSNNADSVTTRVRAPQPLRRTDLAISEDTDFRTVAKDGVVTYTITIRNRGPRPAAGVIATKTLSSAADVLSATPEQGRCRTRVATICRIGRLAPGERVTIKLRVRPRRTGELRDTASVVGDGVDRRRVNNFTGVTTRVVEPTFKQLRKTASARTIRAGRSVRFRITLRALGPEPIRGARVCDRLPAQLTFARAPGARVSGRQACWRVRSLAAGRSRTFRVTARAGLTARTRRVTNTATVRGGNVRGATARAAVRAIRAPRRACPAVGSGGTARAVIACR